MDTHFTYKDNINHEYNIGLELNNIRNLVSNFIATFGLFKCNIGYNITIPCSINNKKYERDYLLLEYIEGNSLLKYSLDKNISNDEYLNILLQILLALNIAYNNIEFVHYNLHMKNYQK